jgi:hypothetical protein
VAAAIGTSDSAGQAAIRLAAVGILLTRPITLARAAMIHSSRADMGGSVAKVAPPGRPVLICNPPVWRREGREVRIAPDGTPDSDAQRGGMTCRT